MKITRGKVRAVRGMIINVKFQLIQAFLKFKSTVKTKVVTTTTVMSGIYDQCLLFKSFVPTELLLQRATYIWRDSQLQHSCFEVITSESTEERDLHCHS